MPTSKAGKLRLLIALPLAATLLFAFRNAAPVTEAITIIESEIAQQDSKNTEELIKQLKQNRAIKSVRSKKIDGKDAIVIGLKGGGTEVYFIGDAANLADLERKYVLPELPPPPPPVRINTPADALQGGARIDDNQHSLVYIIDPDNINNTEFEAARKAFQQQGYDLNISPKYKSNELETLRIAVKSEKGASVSTTYRMDELRKNDYIIIVQADKSTGKAYVVSTKKEANKLPPPPPPVPAAPAAPDSPPAPPAPPAPVKTTKGTFMGLSEGLTYYVDGLEDKNENYKKLDPKQIHAIHVVKGESATERFRKKGANGVVSIVTQENKDAKQVKEFLKKLPATPAPPIPVKVEVNLPSPASSVRAPEVTQVALTINPTTSISEKELNYANRFFKQNGFNVEFRGHKTGEEITGVTITAKHRDKNEGTSSYYSVAELKERNYAVIVAGNKETGEVTSRAVPIP